MQGIEVEREHPVVTTAARLQGHEHRPWSISLTAVCDATLGFAADILIRAITPGQADLHGKRPPCSRAGSNIQRWESLLVLKLIILPELLKSLLVATFWELTTYFYPLQVILLTDIYRK